ncbi:MAG: methyltransferase domain-containing protein [Bdellovibrionia bacterium]
MSMTIDPKDPYPLLPGFSDLEAMQYSEQVDHWLGFDIVETEKKIHARLGNSRLGDPQEYWVGLNIQSLLTPYTEIRRLLDQLEIKPGDTLIDLGAGYGRIGFVMGHYYPESFFIGYEAVEERVSETLRCLSPLRYSNVRMELADLSSPDFKPEPADYYFIYDYGTRPAVEKTLEDLKEVARTRKITVIGRGRLSRDAIERHHPWLSQVEPPKHFKNYSIYYSA